MDIPTNQEGIVEHIHDGDTLWLQGGQKVRLLGINAPEVGHRKKRGEPLGEEARNWLRERLPKGTRVQLLVDQKPRDKHGRQLAHIIHDGENLQAKMLAKGLVETLIIPPNTLYAECYQSQEALARQAEHGLWQHRYFSYREQPRKTGRQRLRGTLVNISPKQRYLELSLDNGVTIRIAKKHLGYFELNKLKQQLNRPLEVRGWLNKRKQNWLMHVNHPSQIYLSSDD